MSFVASSVVYPDFRYCFCGLSVRKYGVFYGGVGQMQTRIKVIRASWIWHSHTYSDSWDVNFFVACREVTWIVPIDEDGRTRRVCGRGRHHFPVSDYIHLKSAPFSLG